jgi:hypothetical protein
MLAVEKLDPGGKQGQASEHPWLKAYFHGKRARAGEAARK